VKISLKARCLKRRWEKKGGRKRDSENVWERIERIILQTWRKSAFEKERRGKKRNERRGVRRAKKSETK